MATNRLQGAFKGAKGNTSKRAMQRKAYFTKLQQNGIYNKQRANLSGTDNLNGTGKSLLIGGLVLVALGAGGYFGYHYAKDQVAEGVVSDLEKGAEKGTLSGLGNVFAAIRNTAQQALQNMNMLPGEEGADAAAQEAAQKTLPDTEPTPATEPSATQEAPKSKDVLKEHLKKEFNLMELYRLRNLSKAMAAGSFDETKLKAEDLALVKRAFQA